MLIEIIENMSVEQKGTKQLKCGFAQMTKGGVIMDVTNYEQAKIAENAGVSKNLNFTLVYKRN